jgi:cytochrome d ubiquinol oxidase subunit II
MFSGFYLALFLMLVTLIVRGVAFEFRSKDRNPRWRGTWDWMIFVGSFVPALLWGVAMGNLIRGVPIDADMTYVGSFWTLLNPYALLGGLVSLTGFTLHGALFLNLKSRGDVAERAHGVAAKTWAPNFALVMAFVVASYFATDMFAPFGVDPGLVPLGAGAALLAAGWLIHNRRQGWAFTMTGLAIALSAVTIFMGLYPRVMVSSLNPDWSLTIYNASSGPYTLKVMSIVAAICVPVVLVYQGWSYWIFRQRVGRESSLEY